jgi:hypothetical protein
MSRQQMLKIVLQAQRINAILDAQATKPPHRGRPEVIGARSKASAWAEAGDAACSKTLLQ